MKRLKHTMLALTTAIALIMLSSCPATVQDLASSEDKPYIDPGIPQNLQIQNGLSDRIVLSWDPVDNADSYIIEYASADQPSEFQRLGTSTFNSFELNVNKINGSLRLDANESYFFSVRAVSYFGMIPRQSQASEIVEGAMAPESIDFLVFPTMSDVTIIWHSPNQIGYDGNNLYEAEYNVRYRKNGEEAWLDVPQQYLDENYVKITTNEFRLEYKEVYDFQIIMTVENSEGNAQVESEIVTATISEDYAPSPIENYRFENNLGDYIGVSWDVPNWANGTLSDGMCYFIIERREDGSSEWIKLIDEVSKGDSSAITFADYEGADEGDTRYVFTCTYHDTSAEPGKKYYYRITNTIRTEAGDFTANEVKQSSEYGEKFYVKASNLNMNPVVDKATADVVLSFSIPSVEFPEGYGLGVLRKVIHPDEGKEPTESIIPGISAEGNQFSFLQSIDCYTCKGRKHTYSYSLAVLNSSGGIYLNLGDFPGSFPLDNTSTAAINEDVEITKSSNRIGHVELTWSVLDELKDQSFDFSYSVDDGIFYSIEDPTTENRISYTAAIPVETTDPVTITLIAETSNKQHYSSVEIPDARAFAFPAGFSPSVSDPDDPEKITVSWNGDGAITDSIEYSYRYRTEGSENWSDYNTIDQFTGDQSIAIERGDLPQDKPVEIEFSAINSVHEDEGSLTSAVVGRFLSAPVNITAGKGEYKDKIIVSWDPVDYASSYEVALCDESGTVGEAPVMTASGASIEYPITEDGTYYFTVRAVNSNGKTEWQTELDGTAVNTDFGETEKLNMGYTLSSVKTASVSTADADADGYYRPFTVVSWERVPGATYYDISVLGETVTVTASGNDHTSDFAVGSPVSEGYISYDAETKTYTYHDNTGILRDSLDISGYTITAKSNSDETDTYSIDGTVRRQLKEIEYIDIVNSVLSHAVTEANKVISDWYPSRGLDWNPEPNRYVDGKLQIITPVSSINHGVNESSNPGWIEINGYSTDKYPGLVLTTDSSAGHVRIWTTGINGTLGSQYVGDQDLLIIGGTDDDGITRGKITISCNSTEAFKYRTAVVTLHNINIVNDSDDEFYTVQIEDNSIKTFPDSDISVKPY